MGYEVTSFVGEIDKEFVCPVCMMVVEQPVVSPCDHIFCTKCIEVWIARDNSCPVDRQRLRGNMLKPAPRFYRNLWNKLNVKCHLQSFGCNSVVPLESLHSHLNNCTYKPNMIVVCDKGCSLRMTRLEYQKSCFAHLTTYLTDKFEKDLNELRKNVETLHDLIRCQGDKMDRLIARTTHTAPPKLTWMRIYNMNLSSDEPNILEPLNTNRFPWATVQFTKVEASTSFRIQVISVTDNEYVVIGLSHANHFDDLPGHQIGSIGYFSQGEIVVHRRAEGNLPKWKNGDIVECAIVLPSDSLTARFVVAEVHFTINGTTVSKKKMKVPDDGFFPTIRMGSFGSSVPKVEYLTQ